MGETQADPLSPARPMEGDAPPRASTPSLALCAVAAGDWKEPAFLRRLLRPVSFA